MFNFWKEVGKIKQKSLGISLSVIFDYQVEHGKSVMSWFLQVSLTQNKHTSISGLKVFTVGYRISLQFFLHLCYRVHFSFMKINRQNSDLVEQIFYN